MSPVLFNMCIEPRLRALSQKKEELGYQTDFGDMQFYVNGLAYADDLVLITDAEEKLEAMLEILREFCEYAHMAVNAKKCCVISSVANNEGRSKQLNAHSSTGKRNYRDWKRTSLRCTWDHRSGDRGRRGRNQPKQD
jgi:hypothetical protein